MASKTLNPLILIAALLLAMPVPAQEGDKRPEMTPGQKAEMDAYMKAGTPGAPHRWLASTAGTYTATVRSWQEPGGPATEENGIALRTMVLGGRVLVEAFSSTMMDSPFTGHGMTGYDNVTGKYWSTWMDSMSTGMMVSEGTCDDSHVCRYTGTYQDPVTKGPATLRMMSRVTSPTTQLFEMWGPGKDGKETKMMEITYTKK